MSLEAGLVEWGHESGSRIVIPYRCLSIPHLDEGGMSLDAGLVEWGHESGSRIVIRYRRLSIPHLDKYYEIIIIRHYNYPTSCDK